MGAAGDSIRNLPWVAFDRAISIAVALAVTAQFARYLGPSEFGRFSIAYSIVALLGAVASLGLNELVVRELRVSQFSPATTMSTMGALQLGMGLGLFGVISFVALVLQTPADASLYLFVLGFTLIFKTTDLFSAFFDATLDTRTVAKLRAVNFIGFALVKLALIYFSAPVFWVVSIFVVEHAIFNLIIITQYMKCHPLGGSYISRDAVTKSLGDGLPIFVSGFLGILYLKLDLLIAYWLIDDQEQLGSLAATIRLIDALSMPIVILSAALGPRIYDAILNKGDHQKHLRILSSLVTSYGILICVVIFLAAEEICFVLFGQQFVSAPDILRLYTCVIIFIGFNLVGAKFYIGNSYLKSGVIRNLISLGLVIVVSILAVDTLEIFGVILGTISGVVYAGLIHDFLFLSARSLFLIKLRSLWLPRNFKEVWEWRKRQWEY